jgi:hypothetical protein
MSYSMSFSGKITNVKFRCSGQYDPYGTTRNCCERFGIYPHGVIAREDCEGDPNCVTEMQCAMARSFSARRFRRSRPVRTRVRPSIHGLGALRRPVLSAKQPRRLQQEDTPTESYQLVSYSEAGAATQSAIPSWDSAQNILDVWRAHPGPKPRIIEANVWDQQAGRYIHKFIWVDCGQGDVQVFP